MSFAAMALACLMLGCGKDEPAQPATPETPSTRFYFRFDSAQARLGNLGQPVSVPAGNAAQSPNFHGMAAHYIELIENEFTPVGQGLVLYQSPDTAVGGQMAIHFARLNVVGDGGMFFSTPTANLRPGTYRYIRVSLAYQNYDVRFWHAGLAIMGRLASFIGYNNYIQSYKVKDSTLVVNGNRLQGYWAFETVYRTQDGQAPGTTVPNPIAATSPIPPGSCLVTGAFQSPLSIAQGSSANYEIEVSLSTNESFEWQDANGNGRWEPLLGEQVVDMGIRGMQARVR